MAYKKDYEAKYHEDVSTFGGHTHDALMILARAMREAGYDREKVRNSIEHMKNFIGTAGIFNFSPTDHNGLDIDAFAMLTVKDGRFVLLEK
jgi:branched-chain amino acid transport system substrate-binding protein